MFIFFSWLVSMYLMILQTWVPVTCHTVSGAILQCKVEEAEMRHKELQRDLEANGSKDTVSYGFLVIQMENVPNHQPKLCVIDKIWRDIGVTLFEGFRKLLLPQNLRETSQKFFVRILSGKRLLSLDERLVFFKKSLELISGSSKRPA